ncbi:hypothetical protein [Rhodobacter ferrooxidans]|uniref:Uncharacterized protein n=1 Tax=Rhodobacter ferrooxidans TaxID=371731 RepID=C8S1X0_9RHOB|nr:hypothetical protein [Rhodobacter sp. SW2]EEW25068.1 hypothetical protein Rsw2DRAFT_2048 [Rhodobacter sp. SW2]
MKQLLLATALIVLPVGAFTAFNLYLTGPGVAATSTTAAPGLGDMSAFSAIVTDVQTIAATGNLAAAKVRIKDFETTWDDQATSLRALDGNAWGTIDDAADAALAALRAGTPDAANVDATLTALQATLTTPIATSAASVDAVLVAGIAVTDANGRALPCEVMLKSVADGLATAKLSDADHAAAVGFQTKALERCNADDDQRADGFSAQALALVAK